MWWGHIPDAKCSEIKREHCSVDVAPGGYVMAMLFDQIRPEDVAISFRCDFQMRYMMLSSAKNHMGDWTVLGLSSVVLQM